MPSVLFILFRRLSLAASRCQIDCGLRVARVACFLHLHTDGSLSQWDAKFPAGHGSESTCLPLQRVLLVEFGVSSICGMAISGCARSRRWHGWIDTWMLNKLTVLEQGLRLGGP
jgi:hypothetical protein